MRGTRRCTGSSLASHCEAWAQEQEQEHEGERLALTPEDLGLRITYLASALVTEEAPTATSPSRSP